ncbi:hypothetical protein BKA65DRAFT_293138 [Rhexocercosporidium sp. MPI-PUGE-AT-0058]|nr:hypothetical protein BKA65DRAFT_293138 [Rhexocercosporidium sp. MPI-PUGE-AT-0058]
MKALLLSIILSILLGIVPSLAADTLVRSACTCIGANTMAYKYTIEYYNGRLQKSWNAEKLCSGPPGHCSLDPTDVGLFCSLDKRFCYRFRNEKGDKYSLDGKDVREPNNAVNVDGGCDEFCASLGDGATPHQVLAQGFFIKPALL